MSIAGLLVRFTGIYVVLSVGIVAAITALALAFSQANTIALLVATIGAVYWFSRRNRRALAKGEFRKAVLGMWVIDIAFQLLVTLATLSAANASLSAGLLLTIVGTVGLINGVFILAIAWFMNRSLAKGLEKEAQAVFE